MISATTPVSPHVSRGAVASGVSPPSGRPLVNLQTAAVEVPGWLSQQDAPCGTTTPPYAGFCRSKLNPSGHHQRPEAALHKLPTFSISPSDLGAGVALAMRGRSAACSLGNRD
jgi:hypothetical protein